MNKLKIVAVLLLISYAVAHDGGYHPPDENEPQCPPVPPGTFGACVELCSQYSCPPNQLCCSNGCGHVCKYPYYHGCPNGKKLVCKRPACDATKCPRQLQATCKGSCFGCIPHFFDQFGNEITKDCKCRRGVRPVECFDDPCRNKNCRGHPNAVCRTNTCGTCEAIFYDRSGNEVECDVPVCEQPKKVGPCEALIPRYYYNKKSKRCEKFDYGGCQGNDNNFQTLKQCQRKCGHDVCNQPKDSGPCEAAIPRYYFNSNKQRCEKFTYGGCQGNDNNFKTSADCNEECGGDVCEQPRDAGPCFGAFPRYYFNSKTQRCEQFTYGGCKGNGNNFEKANDCIERCGGDVCTLPADSGRCLAFIPRYFFNYKTNRCEKFTYGGCEGNENNFETLKQCKRRCGGNMYDENCPRITGGGGICIHECSSNDDCKNGKICCSNGCGSVCTAPRIDDRCPPPDPEIIRTLPSRICPQPSCYSNDVCRKGDICCSNGCQQNCISPPFTDPRCPKVDGAAGPRRKRCQSNKDCPGTKICCSNGGGTECKSLQDERCPPPDPDIIASLPFITCLRGPCEDNSDCRRGKICCSNGCTNQCIDPPTSQCPDPNSFNRACFVYLDQCQNDGECTNGEICCLVAGCGKECMSPKSTTGYDPRCKPSVAPVSLGISCPKICETNSDCRSDYMCCGLYCGSQCTPKPRSCDPGEYLAKCFNLCKGKVCKKYPGAKCRVHGCDGCKAEFYDEATGRLINDCDDGPFIPPYAV